MDDREILRRLRGIRERDPYFAVGRIVSSVCTKPLDVALDAFRLFSDVNALDTYIFSSVKGLEEESIRFMGEMLKNKDAGGYISTGGTESNLTALYIASKRSPDKKEIIIPRSAHYSIEKAADILGLRVRWVGLDERYKADVGEIKRAINGSTLAVVATAGTSALGVVDPVEQIDDLCSDVYFHIDAAFGGFVLPYIKNRVADFRLQNLDSVTVDPHKMGLAPMPSGAILFRDRTYLESIKQEPEYLSVSTHTLSGSRSGGAIAATWATFMHYGAEGYRVIVEECMENTALVCNGLKQSPRVSLVTEPEINMLGIRLPDIEKNAAYLTERGWRIAANKELSCIRFVLMPHVTKEAIREFLSDLREIK